MSNDLEPKSETIAETDNFIAWRSQEPDGEMMFNINLGMVTLHFYTEDWTEFLNLVRLLVQEPPK